MKGSQRYEKTSHIAVSVNAMLASGRLIRSSVQFSDPFSLRITRHA